MENVSTLNLYCNGSIDYFFAIILLESHNWPAMVEGIQNYISSLNWGHRVALKDAKVTYLNEFAEFINDHTISVSGRLDSVA
jgi:pyruvate/2-oxoglutarate dehydrogenase complex dihydrolipoamide dehydrogenase (E3) component